MSTPQPVSVKAQGISVTLGGNDIIHDVSLELHPGELTALIGPNGAGKSTLFAALSGDVTPTSGEVLINGQPVGAYKAKELARLRSVMPQDQVARFSFSVEEIVALGRMAFNTSPAEDEEIVNWALSTTEVDAFRLRDVQTLSGGEMARTSFSRVLAQTTPIVFLDEPTAALDLRHQELVMSTARKLRDEGAVVIVVVHDLNLAAAHADRIAMLADGRLIADGTPEEVLTAERITEIYRQRVVVIDHPERDAKLILTV